MEWITFQGKKVSTETADHQHLSNCIWFTHIFLGSSMTYFRIRHEMELAIKERFNGQILPYRPHVDFEEEIEGLRTRGYLSEFNYDGVALIIFEGKIIGEVRKFPLELPEELSDKLKKKPDGS